MGGNAQKNALRRRTESALRSENIFAKTRKTAKTNPTENAFGGGPEYLYGIVKLYDDVFAERVRSGECFQCGGEVQKKGEIPTMPCGAIL